MDNTYKVYIKIESNGYVIAIDSEWNINDLTDWIEIDEGSTSDDKYHHAQGNYFNKPLTDDNGCHNYVYENGAVRETTTEEKAVELDSFPKPTKQLTWQEYALDFEYRLSLQELGGVNSYDI